MTTTMTRTTNEPVAAVIRIRRAVFTNYRSVAVITGGKAAVFALRHIEAFPIDAMQQKSAPKGALLIQLVMRRLELRPGITSM